MIIYNYITTNNITGKQYIGMHSGESVDDRYLGSGTLILKAIKKHGRKNFTKSVLCVCQTFEEANNNEAKYIKQYNTLYPNGYNLSPTGGLGFIGCHSEETRAKMIGNKNPLGVKRSEETRKKMSEAMKGNTHGFQKGTTHMVGRKASEETRRKMSESRKGVSNGFYGKKHTDESRQRMKANHADVSGAKNYNYGKHISEETRKKISESKKGKPGHLHSEETKIKMSLARMGRKRKLVA